MFITDAGYKRKIEQLERMVGQLTMDNELLKKALKSSNNHKNRNVRFSETISPLTKTFRRGCEVMDLLRSTYYYKSKDKPTEVIDEGSGYSGSY